MYNYVFVYIQYLFIYVASFSCSCHFSFNTIDIVGVEFELTPSSAPLGCGTAMKREESTGRTINTMNLEWFGPPPE